MRPAAHLACGLGCLCDVMAADLETCACCSGPMCRVEAGASGDPAGSTPLGQGRLAAAHSAEQNFPGGSVFEPARPGFHLGRLALASSVVGDNRVHAVLSDFISAGSRRRLLWGEVDSRRRS
jgi:hypothetical protein